jgi:hypothetical protein
VRCRGISRRREKMMNRKNKVFLFTALCLMLGVAVYLGWHKAESQSKGLPDFNSMSKPLPDLQPGEGEALVALVVSRLKGEPNQPPFPERLKKDEEARVCFITLADGKGGRKVAVGSGWGLPGALSQAAGSLSKDPLSKNYRWIKLDIVKGAQALKDLDLDRPLTVDPSLFGIAVDGKLEKAILPEELSLLALESGKGISLDLSNRLLRETRVGQKTQEIVKSAREYVVFNTISYFGDGKSAWPLFRGNREWKAYSEKDIDLALEKAGKYLARSVKDDGRFVYEYKPYQGREVPEYNILRHAGTVFAMMELYGARKDPEVRKAAEKAIGYLLRQVRAGAVSGRPVKFVVEEGEVKLGGNGLSALALAEYARVTRDHRYDEVMKGLGEWMLATQDTNGRFKVHKQSFPLGRVSSFQSEYYPGEAIFALMRIYDLTGEKKWLDAADAGTRYQLKVFSQLDDRRLPHDHWLLYGLNEVHRKRPRPGFLEGAMRFARVIIQAQHTRENQPQPDWDGGYYKPPRSAPTATRMEGLNSAYALAKDFGRDPDAKQIKRAIEKGTGFLLRIQVGPEIAMYCQDPEASLGGFRESLARASIRIDYVQHSISALLRRPK